MDRDSNLDEIFYDFDQTGIEITKTTEGPPTPYFDTPKTSPPKNTLIGHNKNQPTSDQPTITGSLTQRNK